MPCCPILTGPPGKIQGRIDAAVRALRENNPRFKDLSPQYVQGLAEFVSGNMLFVLLHEMAHVFITQMELPVLGRMEDAADSYAALRLIRSGSNFSHRVLIQAAEGWFMADRRDQKMDDNVAFYDEHGLNQQRAYQIVCLMVGSDDEKFKDLAKETKLPEERRDACAGDYSSAAYSWDLVLKPHRRAPIFQLTNLPCVTNSPPNSPTFIAPMATCEQTAGQQRTAPNVRRSTHLDSNRTASKAITNASAVVWRERDGAEAVRQSRDHWVVVLAVSGGRNSFSTNRPCSMARNWVCPAPTQCDSAGRVPCPVLVASKVICATRSATVGTPKMRCPPDFFGMGTARHLERLPIHPGRARIGFDRFVGVVHQLLVDIKRLRLCRIHRFILFPVAR
jgi:hypothetical protein